MNEGSIKDVYSELTISYDLTLMDIGSVVVHRSVDGILSFTARWMICKFVLYMYVIKIWIIWLYKAGRRDPMDNRLHDTGHCPAGCRADNQNCYRILQKNFIDVYINTV